MGNTMMTEKLPAVKAWIGAILFHLVNSAVVLVRSNFHEFRMAQLTYMPAGV
jgi:hypothetical protein